MNVIKKWEDSFDEGFDAQKYCKAEIRGKEPYREMAGFMDGFKKEINGGTSEFAIKVPPFPRRCHLLIYKDRQPLGLLITRGNKQRRQGHIRPTFQEYLSYGIY
jgi:hypothetical protein